MLHLLIPQLENACLNIVEDAGGNIYKENKMGGYNIKVLNDILRDPLLINCLGSDAALYFQVLFSDLRGSNLRNEICHGLRD